MEPFGLGLDLLDIAHPLVELLQLVVKTETNFRMKGKEILLDAKLGHVHDIHQSTYRRTHLRILATVTILGIAHKKIRKPLVQDLVFLLNI